jgi:hypothetical protein
MTQKPFLAAAAALLFMTGMPALAQDTQPASEATEDNTVTLELNKLQASEKGCRAFLVVSNPSSTKYDKFQIDLVMFQSDGVIGSRFAVELAPLLPSKRSIKEFVLTDTQCDSIGSFLVNDIMECSADAGPVNDCLARLKVNSLTKVEISK